jgi:hypothetical protein
MRSTKVSHRDINMEITINDARAANKSFDFGADSGWYRAGESLNSVGDLASALTLCCVKVSSSN